MRYPVHAHISRRIAITEHDTTPLVTCWSWGKQHVGLTFLSRGILCWIQGVISIGMQAVLRNRLTHVPTRLHTSCECISIDSVCSYINICTLQLMTDWASLCIFQFSEMRLALGEDIESLCSSFIIYCVRLELSAIPEDCLLILVTRISSAMFSSGHMMNNLHPSKTCIPSMELPNIMLHIS